MDLQLEGARALVGGASQGIGAGIALALAGEGARVAALGRDAQRLADTVTRSGGIPIVADLATAEGPPRAVDRAVEQLGGLDVLVANTGGPPHGRFDQLDERDWATAIEGTLQAPLRLIRAALPQLERAQRAAILLVLSSSVRVPLPGLMTSNVLRPGLAGLVRGLAGELPANVRINAICPGRIDTARLVELDEKRAQESGAAVEQVRAESQQAIPLGRYGTPTELGEVAAFLLSARAGYVHGQVISVDGGATRSAG